MPNVSLDPRAPMPRASVSKRWLERYQRLRAPQSFGIGFHDWARSSAALICSGVISAMIFGMMKLTYFFSPSYLADFSNNLYQVNAFTRSRSIPQFAHR